MNWTALALFTLALARLPPLPPRDAPERGSCYRCHSELAGDLATPAKAFEHDVHAQRGLGCVACHGGDAKAEDAESAMDARKGFVGKPARRSIPELCGGCHANAAFVKQFAPNLPTDQLSQYRTSVHAKKLAEGNEKAAVCTSCHGAHGIVSARTASSPVYPTHVVDTCARCHARPDGTGPVAEYERSVHYEALTKKDDLSAPTCNKCHGSHGAAPPGVESVSAVCGQCHARNMELFRASPHQAAFDALSLGACEGCHGNHDIRRPDDAWVGVRGDEALCGRCHAADDPGGKTAARIGDDLRRATALDTEARRQVGKARAAGVLMIDSEVDLQQAHDQIIQARTDLHSVDALRVEQYTDAAAAAARKALAGAASAFAEIRYRRTGLVVALALILLAIVAVFFKIRELDRRRDDEAARRT